MWSDLKADLALARQRRPDGLASYLFPNIFAVAGYRVAHALGSRGFAMIARAISMLVQLLTGAEIEWMADLGPGLFLEHTSGVVIGGGVVTGRELVLGAGVLLGSSFGESRSEPRFGFPEIDDNVRIWSKASLIGPIKIGSGAVVGAHTLVLHDIPAGAVARGVPARAYIDGQVVRTDRSRTA